MKQLSQLSYINTAEAYMCNPKTSTMKTDLSIVVSLLALCILMCATDAADAAAEAVRDTTGKIVRTGTAYYILPLARGSGGGLTLGSSRNGSCPPDVVQERREISNGLPLTFTPTNPKEGVVRLSTDLNIQFSAASICVQSTVWKLKSFDEEVRQWFVTTGGVKGNPGQKTVDNWFKIDKHWVRDNQFYYKLVFCPTVCNFCKVICRDVGVFVDNNGVRRLALGTGPFFITLKKA